VCGVERGVKGSGLDYEGFGVDGGDIRNS